jgi:GntR family transcriptional regulator
MLLYTVIVRGAIMKIILINGSSIPLYEQIKNAIKENIVEGVLSSEEQLPSVRQLSGELSVSILTVKKAYDELEKEGFIVIRQGLGTFVASTNPDILRDEKQKEIERNLITACKIAKSINLSKAELTELLHYIYKGDMYDE